MNFEEKLLILTGAIGVGVIIDIISLLFNYENLFSLGTLIMAIALLLISIILYIELKKYKGEK